MTIDVADLKTRLEAFMAANVYPNEKTVRTQLAEHGEWLSPPIIEELKDEARNAGLWNLWCPDPAFGPGLNNEQYAPLCEVMGRSLIAPEVFNCNAPDTGNMETLLKYGTDEQQRTWMTPLLRGEIRSAFCMTEPDVASSDARNISSSIRRDGNEYVINGRKWWSSGAGDPRCKILIFMGVTEDEEEAYRRHSMILVPMETPGVEVVRHLPVYGFDHGPKGHMEITFTDVRVPVENMLLGEGRGFEIAQGRLGPGRIHHCMRLIGTAERSVELMCTRAASRVAFGRPIAEQGMVREDIARSRIEVDQARLLTLETARRIDAVGAKAARSLIAQIKVAVPEMATKVIDRAVQIHGAAGVTSDYFLSAAWVQARLTRIADGPDAVHLRTIAKMELAKQALADS